jgi:hypothetical protein
LPPHNRMQTQRIRSRLRIRGFGLRRRSTSSWVSKDQILKRKVLAGTTAINKDAQQHQEEAQHRRGSISGQGRQRVHDPDRLLPPFSSFYRWSRHWRDQPARRPRIDTGISV